MKLIKRTDLFRLPIVPDEHLSETEGSAWHEIAMAVDAALLNYNQLLMQAIRQDLRKELGEKDPLGLGS